MSEVTAILGPRSSEVADYFFDSEVVDSSTLVSVLVLVERALVFEELAILVLDFGQSLTMCPLEAHRRQSPWSTHLWCSPGRSLPSFPSFDKRSGNLAKFEDLKMPLLLLLLVPL